MPVQIKKRSGISEQFNEEKIYHSMRNAGVEHSLAQEVSRMLGQDSNNLVTSEDLHRRTGELLLMKHAASAARYNLKQAIMALGPTGYPFEKFVAQVLQAHGYTAVTNQIVQGRCVSHEIDVIAKQANNHYLIECKHHQFAGAKTDVKVMLYVYARFLDVKQAWEATEQTATKGAAELHQPWVITNTRATSEAIQYGQCTGMKLTAWHYPQGQGLNHLIEQKQLYPITALPQLTHKEANILLMSGIITIQDLLKFTVTQLNKKTKIRPNVLEDILTVAAELVQS